MFVFLATALTGCTDAQTKPAPIRHHLQKQSKKAHLLHWFWFLGFSGDIWWNSEHVDIWFSWTFTRLDAWLGMETHITNKQMSRGFALTVQHVHFNLLQTHKPINIYKEIVKKDKRTRHCILIELPNRMEINGIKSTKREQNAWDMKLIVHLH